MTGPAGSPPVPTVTLDQSGYRRGGQVRASVAITDPDNRIERLATDGTAPDGTALHSEQTLTYSDRPLVSWRWKGSTAVLGTGLTLTVPVPARSGVLEAVVVDAQGHEVVAGCPVPVSALQVGVDVDTTSTPTYWRAELDAAIGGLTATGPTKLFWSPTKGLPSFTKYGVPSSMIPHLCFKDMPTQQQWTGLLDTVPDTWGEAWLTWNQEGDRSTDPLTFVSQWERLAAWVAGHPNRSRVRLVANLTWYWQHAKNADGYARFIPRGVDYLGVDIYPGGQSGWTPLGDCLDAPVRAAASVGLPLVIPEFGVVVPTAASAAQLRARADWVAAGLDAMDAAGVYAAAYWSAPPTSQTGVFRLSEGDPALEVLRSWWTADGSAPAN